VMFCCRAARVARDRMARVARDWMARVARGRMAAVARGRMARLVRPARTGQMSSDRGSNVVELAVLAPGLMMICMLILQFGLWFNARQAALASAQAGALVAREQAATNSGWAGAAQNAAAQYYGNLHTHLLSKVKPHAYGDSHTNVFVTVSGPLGYSVFPFFGLNLTISATAGGPVECFRPATQNRCG
jgi:TadE-like protein